jgi:hypothetical protein
VNRSLCASRCWFIFLKYPRAKEGAMGFFDSLLQGLGGQGAFT